MQRESRGQNTPEPVLHCPDKHCVVKTTFAWLTFLKHMTYDQYEKQQSKLCTV